MSRPRIIIADTDVNYIQSLQLKFIEEFFEKIDLEIITEREYFDELFSVPQKAEILVVSEDLYESSLQRHNISKVFLMVEQDENDGTEELNVNKIFKYSSIKEIFNEILGKSASVLNVESDEKQGTVFTVDLPVRTCEVSSLEDSSATSVSEVSPLNNAVPVEEEELEKNYDSSKPSVLIIDDNADIRLYVHGLLHADYTVIEAADGSEGIRKAMKYVPDLIISDVMMPGIDGVECCRRLKSELQTCHIPVILLTACSLDEQRIQGYDGGADSYISKPFSSQLLLARVRNLIDSHRRLKQFFGDGQALAKEDVCDMDKEFVEKFKALIDEKMGDSGLNVEDLGKDMGLSRVQLYRKIKSLTNYSPNELLRIARLKKAASLLASSDMTVSEIGYEVGFSSPSYFAKCYKELFGESPTDLLKRKG